MDMKCYEFKDGRRLFRWIYLHLFLSITSVAILFFKNKLVGTPMVPSTIVIQVIAYFVIIIIFFRKTRTQVFVDDTKLKVKRMIHFMSITDIKVTHDIEIITESTVDVIKLIDLENNYDKYKELFEQILGKVDRNVARAVGSADKLLQSAAANTKQRYSSHKLADGKVELGGWLTYFNVIAYFAVVGGAISFIFLTVVSLLGLEDVGTQQNTMHIQIGLLFVVNLAIIILLSKRKNSAKYALAVMPATGIIFAFYNSVIDIIYGTGFAYIFLVVSGLIVSIISSLLLVKIYIEYIDTFERPKQTLIN